MSEMPKRTAKGFAAQLEDAFQAASADRDKIKPFKELASKRPAEAAEVVCKAIPRLMQRVRTQAHGSHGVEIALEGWKEQFKRKQHSHEEAGLLLMAANYYLVYSWCQTKLDAYAADRSLSKEERTTKVCEVGIEALRGTEAVLLHNLQEELARADGEAASFVKDVLALRLAGELPTRISLYINKPLAKGLDDIREHKKPFKRERLETLRRELYNRAPASFAEHHLSDWQLEATRNAVVKKIEVRATPRPPAKDLAAFVDREEMARLAKAAKLSPQELEFYELFITGTKPKEVAKQKGVTPDHARQVKHRISNKLRAAGF